MMYLDRSSRKFRVVGTIFIAFAFVVYASFALIAANHARIVRGENALARARAGIAYWVSFKLPQDGRVALAAAGLARASETQDVLSATGTAKSVPVLLYHGEGAAAGAMPESTFVAQLRALKADGWQTITMAQFEAFMNGTGSVPDKSFLLTFDDGRKDTFYNADPALADLGFHAVMFVITGLSLPNNSDQSVNGFYLTKSELAYMQQSGRWDLESHGDQDHRSYAVPASATSSSTMLDDEHFLSNKFIDASTSAVETDARYEARIRGDLSLSKDLLAQDFGTPVVGYAYPFNDFGQESVNNPSAQAEIAAIVPSLYRFAFYQTWAGNGDSFNYPDASGYSVKRIEPGVAWSGGDLMSALDGGRAKPLPYAASSFGTDWEANWGSVSTGPTLLLAASSTTGAAAFLDGTEGWKDYRIRATAQVTAGTLSLVARHTETDAPYLVCAFSDNAIYLEQHSGEEQFTLAKAAYSPPPLPALITANMTVEGGYASCSAYGVAVGANVAGIARAGGVGASVWDPENGAAKASLTSFSVTGL